MSRGGRSVSSASLAFLESNALSSGSTSCLPSAIKKILARARQLVDAKKEDGFTALHLAALNNHKEVAEILIKEVKNCPEKQQVDVSGHCHLSGIVLQGDLCCVGLRIKKLGLPRQRQWQGVEYRKLKQGVRVGWESVCLGVWEQRKGDPRKFPGM